MSGVGSGSGSGSGLTRIQLVWLFLVLMMGIAAGLSIFSSASNIIALFRQATAGLFLPILLSLILTFLLEPPVRYIERAGYSRVIAIFVVYLVVALLMAAFVLMVAPHWQKMYGSLQADFPRYLAKATIYLKGLQSAVVERFPVVADVDLVTKGRIQAEMFFTELVVQTPKSALKIGSLAILVPLVTFFFIKDGHWMMRRFISLTPNRYFEMVHALYYQVSRQLGSFIRGRILEAAIIGVVITVGLSMTDIRYAPMLGIFAGVTNLLPYIGPIIGMVPGLLIALVDHGLGGEFWWILIVYLLIAQIIIDNFILIPILISRVSNLHPLAVILAIIMGGKLYGVVGMIIGVPIVSIIKIVVIEVQQYRRPFSLPEG